MSTPASSATIKSSNKRTRLDRSLKILLFDENDRQNGINNETATIATPSQRDGIDGSTERLYRLYGASLIQQASRLLGTSGIRPSTCITAMVIFQRLYHRLSLRSMDIWAAAMGALFCAAKTEEIPLTARQVIVTFVHLYRKRRMLLVKDVFASEIQKHCEHIVVSPKEARISFEEKRQQLKNAFPALSSIGPIWKEWFDALVHAEGQILRSLGFLLYWIPNEHAHRFIPGFLQALNLHQYTDLCQKVWSACNQAYQLDTCVRFPAEVICTAAILISVHDLSPSVDWWKTLIGPDQEQALADCANIMLGIRKEEKIGENGICPYKIGFFKPLAAKSFNGPGSFLWEMAEGNL